MKINELNKATTELLEDFNRICVQEVLSGTKPSLVDGFQQWVGAGCPDIAGGWYSDCCGNRYSARGTLTPTNIIYRFLSALGLPYPQTESCQFPEAGAANGATFISGGGPPVTHEIGGIKLRVAVWSGFRNGGYKYTISTPGGVEHKFSH